jgi:hypothetical protein
MMFVKTVDVLSFAILGLAAPLVCMFCLIQVILPLNKLNHWQLHVGGGPNNGIRAERDGRGVGELGGRNC